MKNEIEKIITKHLDCKISLGEAASEIMRLVDKSLEIGVEQLRQKYIAKDAVIQQEIKEIESELENIKGEEILQSIMQEDLSVKQAISTCFKTFIMQLKDMCKEYSTQE